MSECCQNVGLLASYFQARSFFVSPLSMSLSRKVLIVGSYNQDLSWKTSNFPYPGQTVLGTFHMNPGGKGSNQAVAAVRAGAHATFVGAVGKDPFGAAAHTFLKNEGLTIHLVEKTEAATGTAAIMVNSAGQNEIIVALGSNLLLTSEDVPDALLNEASIIICPLEAQLTTVEGIFKRAKQAGARTLLNPAPMPKHLPPEILKHTDIIVPNEGEFAQLISQIEPGFDTASILADLSTLPHQAIHQACRILKIDHVIITLGEKGVFVSSPTEYFYLPAIPVKVIDTTGAGDAFIGGLTTSLIENPNDMYKAVCFANCTAALAVTKPGAAPSFPLRPEIDALLKKHLKDKLV